MHSCLLIDEIATTVIRNLCGLNRDADVLHLALTCRALHEPAMDALWARTSWVLGKLLLCLPSDAVVLRRSRQSAYIIVIARTLVQSEWSRFQHYAKRVEHVDLGTPWDGTSCETSLHIDLDTLKHMLRSKPWLGALLPNLRSIYLLPVFQAYLPLLLHSNITHFYMDGDEYMTCTDIQRILEPLQVCAPRLESFVLRTDGLTEGPDGEVISKQSTLFASFTALHLLDTSVPLTQTSFAHLGTHTVLRKICLSAHVLPSPAINAAAPISISFPHLRELKLTDRAVDLSRLLGLCSAPHLTTLWLIVTISAEELNAPLAPTPNPSAYCMDHLAAALSRFTALETLHVELHHGYLDKRPPGRQLMHGDAFLPLTALRDLRCLTLREFPVHLTPSVVAALARAWPRLERLELSRKTRVRDEARDAFNTGICIEDLYPLAAHCPSLRSLVLSVAPTPPATPFFRADEGMIVQRRLEHLDLRYSRVRSGQTCERIARFLGAVFPNAQLHSWEENRKIIHEIERIMQESAILEDTFALRSYPL
ncbi:hypothetical protein PsYK624_112180 [Phanerochaete sordida]|uniref:F-box domain-containing protein n=1 Tax=Phanerochaete sordida TaxID=48140 RepID=A0A9P3GIT3_9APHY|nr:hypothetical protein PsYK624_112180 [Phanerochaete sordida]